jgi:hypothetical protein
MRNVPHHDQAIGLFVSLEYLVKVTDDQCTVP